MQTVSDLREFLSETGIFNVAVAADALDLYLTLEREARTGSRGHWRVPGDFTFAPESQLAADIMMPPVMAAIRAYLALDTVESLASAASLLQQCRRYAESTNARRRLVEIGVLEALLHAARGEEEAALDALRASVLLAELGGALRLIADAGPGLRPYLQMLCDQGVAPAYLARVLAAYAIRDTVAPPASVALALPYYQLTGPSGVSPDLVEDLTIREVEVLRLLAQGLPNKEIAAELIISPNTVKKHTINIYRKLHVPNRQRAIRAARTAGYLPQER
jgi:LuxR family maltose regulon positive regulatory protein